MVISMTSMLMHQVNYPTGCTDNVVLYCTKYSTGIWFLKGGFILEYMIRTRYPSSRCIDGDTKVCNEISYRSIASTTVWTQSKHVSPKLFRNLCHVSLLYCVLLCKLVWLPSSLLYLMQSILTHSLSDALLLPCLIHSLTLMQLLSISRWSVPVL